LWLCGFGKCCEIRLQRNRLLAGNREKARHKGLLAGDRQGREMDLRHRHDMKEIRRMGDRELGASRQQIEAGDVSRVDPVGLAPDALDRAQADGQQQHGADPDCRGSAPIRKAWRAGGDQQQKEGGRQAVIGARAAIDLARQQQIGHKDDPGRPTEPASETKPSRPDQPRFR
jgi:hypothetical protein